MSTRREQVFDYLDKLFVDWPKGIEFSEKEIIPRLQRKFPQLTPIKARFLWKEWAGMRRNDGR